MPLTLRIHGEELSLCKLPLNARVPAAILAQPFSAFIRTHNEATLICLSTQVPDNAKAESGFIALEIIGPFDFGQSGILAQIAEPLAEAEVAIFPLLTFDTDYILIKASKRTAAVAALQKAGHVITA